MNSLLTRQEIENAIFEGIYPTKIFKSGLLTLIFVISERKFPASLEGWYDFFKHAISVSGLDDSRIFLKTLPVPLFYRLIKDYKDFYINWLKSIAEHISDISADSRSRTTWNVCQKTAINTVIPVYVRLNTAQYFWVAFNAAKDKDEKTQLISDIFDMLKPWLNMELWQHIEKDKDDSSKRINVLEEEQIKEYEQSLQNPQINDFDEITME